MSTFDGNIREFPDIQVDYFRTPSNGCRPLACFLSHVHSDHLVGLEGLRSPFVYCSAATKALLLKLERYPCRVNFSKGILEARQRTYKDLKHLLKPLPLDTPTVIELSPGNLIQVTLLDANHCPGSVMFLFENNTAAALYTGDTRCEPWFVNALVRNPCLAEYMAGLRVLDTVYLDTTCIRKDVHFQTKSEGLCDLLQQVARYPPDTVFHFRAWTFGYEDVWLALAKTLQSRVHVDQYKMDLYKSLYTAVQQPSSSGRLSSPRGGPAPMLHLSPEAPGLVGFMLANAIHEGCLTTDEGYDGGVRLHSCDKSTGYCPAVIDHPVVWIYPVVCRLPRGQGDVAEVGVGGGGEDPSQNVGEEGVPAADGHDAWNSKSYNSESGKIEGLDSAPDFKEEHSSQCCGLESRQPPPPAVTQTPRSISFPYSRHSSYPELCHLLSELRPRDVWPCTVREEEWFNNGRIVTIQDLFGQYCTGDRFRHDEEVAAKMQHRIIWEVEDSQATMDSELYSAAADIPRLDWADEEEEHNGGDEEEEANEIREAEGCGQHRVDAQEDGDSGLPFFYPGPWGTRDGRRHHDFYQDDSQASTVTEFSRQTRMQSHAAIIQNAISGDEWVHIGLCSTVDNHSRQEVDLGYG